MSEVRLQPILKRSMNDFINSLNFSMVARVTGISKLVEGLIDVHPIVNNLTSDMKDIPFAEIKDVPLQVQSTTLASVTLPINIGDDVTLIFPQTSIQEYKYGMSLPHDQSSLDGFKLHNAIAIIGATNSLNTPYSPLGYTNPYNNNNINIVMNKGLPNESSIVISAEGSIVTNSTTVTHFAESVDHMDALVNVDNDIIIRGMSLYDFMMSHVHNYTDDGNPMVTDVPTVGG